MNQRRPHTLIHHAACNTHAGREFVAEEKNYPLEAAKALVFYRRLHAVETPCKLLPEPERIAFRRRESLPIWDGFRQWINTDALRGALSKYCLGKTLTYVNNHGESLHLYLDDRRLPIDNNRPEQTSWLFVLKVGIGPSWNVHTRLRDA